MSTPTSTWADLKPSLLEIVVFVILGLAGWGLVALIDENSLRYFALPLFALVLVFIWLSSWTLLRKLRGVGSDKVYLAQFKLRAELLGAFSIVLIAVVFYRFAVELDRMSTSVIPAREDTFAVALAIGLYALVLALSISAAARKIAIAKFDHEVQQAIANAEAAKAAAAKAEAAKAKAAEEAATIAATTVTGERPH